MKDSYGLIQSCNSLEFFSKITAIIDKIDKIGHNKFIEELKNDIPNQHCWKLFNELFLWKTKHLSY